MLLVFEVFGICNFFLLLFFLFRSPYSVWRVGVWYCLVLNQSNLIIIIIFTRLSTIIYSSIFSLLIRPSQIKTWLDEFFSASICKFNMKILLDFFLWSDISSFDSCLISASQWLRCFHQDHFKSIWLLRINLNMVVKFSQKNWLLKHLRLRFELKSLWKSSIINS